MQVHSIAVLHHDYNIRFWLLVAIAKDLSKHAQTTHYKHGEPGLGRERLHQCSISFAVVDWLKVSPDLVQGDSLNFIPKLVL